MSEIFKVKGKDKVDYDEFLYVHDFYEDLFKLTSHIFGCCINHMRKNRFGEFKEIIQ